MMSVSKTLMSKQQHSTNKQTNTHNVHDPTKNRSNVLLCLLIVQTLQQEAIKVQNNGQVLHRLRHILLKLEKLLVLHRRNIYRVQVGEWAEILGLRLHNLLEDQITVIVGHCTVFFYAILCFSLFSTDFLLVFHVLTLLILFQHTLYDNKGLLLFTDECCFWMMFCQWVCHKSFQQKVFVVFCVFVVGVFFRPGHKLSKCGVGVFVLRWLEMFDMWGRQLTGDYGNRILVDSSCCCGALTTGTVWESRVTQHFRGELLGGAIE